MSKSTFGWRQAGFAGVAAALVAGGALVGIGTANAAASTLTLVPGQTKTAVHAGGTDQALAPVVFTTDNHWNTNSTLTFTVAGNDCSTAAGIAKAISFAPSTLTLGFANVTPGGGTAEAPSIQSSGTLGSTQLGLGSSSTACATKNIKDTYTVGIADPRDADAADASDRLAFTIGNAKINVGATTPLGNVTVNASGSFGTASVVQAEVVGTTFAVDGFTAVKPYGSATVGATIKESGAGATFTTGSQDVVLRLANPNGATFDDTTANKPTVTASAGHTVGAVVVETDQITIPVTTAAGAGAATITVSGIRINTQGVTQLGLTSNVGSPNVAKALNVMNFNERIGGQNRYDTAARLFNEGPGENNDDAVLVNGSDASFADALSAGYLAAQLDDGDGTGILLTGAKSLPSETLNAILTNNVETVYVVGGNLVVSDAIVDQLRATRVGGRAFGPNIIVKRIAGHDRYKTNKAVNEYFSHDSDTVLVATGASFPDALAFAPIAYRQWYPLVLTDGKTLSPEASAQLDNRSPSNVVIAGSSNAVSTAVETAIDNKAGIAVSRLGGTNRTDTAALIAEWATTGILKADGTTNVSGFLGNGLGFDEDATNIASGATPADALAAGPYAGDNGEVILLSNNASSTGTGIVSYLGKKRVANVEDIVGFGLQGALANSVLKDAAIATQLKWSILD